MDLTDTDILLTIVAVMAVVGAPASLLARSRRRRAAAAESARLAAHRAWMRQFAAAPRGTGPDAATTGRHDLPEALLGGITYRLSADRLARAKVPDADAG